MESLGCVVDDRDGQRLVGSAPRTGTKQPKEMRRPTALTRPVTGAASTESPARGKPAGGAIPQPTTGDPPIYKGTDRRHRLRFNLTAH